MSDKYLEAAEKELRRFAESNGTLYYKGVRRILEAFLGDRVLHELNVSPSVGGGQCVLCGGSIRRVSVGEGEPE